MSTYRIGTITGSQAGLSVTALIQEIEWGTSATELNRQTVPGAIYASNLINPRAEAKIRAVVPREYASIPAAGGSITVKGCSFGAGSMSLNMDGNSGQTFLISASRVVATNQQSATLEIAAYFYIGAPSSASFDWILTDEQNGDEYRNVVSFANPDPDKYVIAMNIVTQRRTTTTKTWRKAIGADAASPGIVNPGGLSPVGWSSSAGRIGRWVCIDAGCSRPYFLNGQVVKEAFVTWQQVSAWEIYNENFTETESDSASA